MWWLEIIYRHNTYRCTMQNVSNQTQWVFIISFTSFSPNSEIHQSLTFWLAGPGLGDFQVVEMVCNVFVFRKRGLSCSFDLLPHPLPPLRCVASLLFQRHERPADPVFILCFLFQTFNHIPLHLPGDCSWSTVLPDPLLSWDPLSQKCKSQEHPAASDGLQVWICEKYHQAVQIKCQIRKLQIYT